MSEWWFPIRQKPDCPMPVLYYSLTEEWHDMQDNPVETAPDDCVRYDLGHWDGHSFLYSNSNHEVFEFSEDENDPNKPTHWQPLSPPPVAA